MQNQRINIANIVGNTRKMFLFFFFFVWCNNSCQLNMHAEVKWMSSQCKNIKEEKKNQKRRFSNSICSIHSTFFLLPNIYLSIKFITHCEANSMKLYFIFHAAEMIPPTHQKSHICSNFNSNAWGGRGGGDLLGLWNNIESENFWIIWYEYHILTLGLPTGSIDWRKPAKIPRYFDIFDNNNFVIGTWLRLQFVHQIDKINFPTFNAISETEKNMTGNWIVLKVDRIKLS